MSIWNLLDVVTKVQVVGRRRSGKKKRMDAPCTPTEERPACLFPTASTALPSFLTFHHKHVSIY
ncbi:hypothetical protein HMPREF0083_01596 [Aneurinibacillus aneurinilyticus ATCC 12856]|uniref:Uncharacterized protein n=1 Tax=Aneurinibacillus aneurinilyticus ATCC 12856 TaxID=649747 RepID=U1X704_ANEAE|nr:hypothetical protein HMPREF0083_01596 [Aneurinibacillus aneurinilyticus ATCC 12856]